MNTIQAIQTRRSVRQYLSTPVERALLEEVIAAAAFAPSWKNTQTAAYIIIDDAQTRETIAQEMLPSFNAKIVRQAPVLIAMTTKVGRSGYNPDGSYTTQKEDRWQYFDAGIACQTLCLAAHEKGLATVIMGLYDEDRLPEFLNLEPDRVLTALIAVGYAAVEPECPKKRSLEELVRYV